MLGGDGYVVLETPGKGRRFLRGRRGEVELGFWGDREWSGREGKCGCERESRKYWWWWMEDDACLEKGGFCGA